MARRPTRVLPFPVRMDPHGQIELFPAPTAPDPFSATQLIIRYSLLQMRVTRIASYLSPLEREHLFGECDLVLPTLERCEEAVAWRESRERAALSDRIA